MARRRTTVALLAAALAATGGLLAAPALAADQGTVRQVSTSSEAVGEIDYTVYLPPGYDEEPGREYPTLYLLHGRGDTMAAWPRVAGDLDELIGSGAIQPLVVVMPDAPWNDRGNWYTDSLYTGSRGAGPGVPVETAFTRDLVAHVDATYRTAEDRAARAVGGYSMGGAGALRFTLAHPDVFSAAIVLSAAVYEPTPPRDSSTRDYGAYGVGQRLFTPQRFRELSYPAALAAFDPALPVHLFVAVGDDEYANPDPRDAEHDLDMEAAKLYTAARRVPGVTAELRVLDGGHDWDVWQPAFREGVVDVASRLRASEAEPWRAELVGTAADDRAGGLAVVADGARTLAVNAGASLDGAPHAGGLDVTLTRRAADGTTAWRHDVATAANDRAYGVVPGADGGVLVAGYTRGDLDGAHPSGASDDAFVVAVDAEGQRRWTLQTGDAGAADRLYAVASDGAGGALVAGYTSGSFAGTPSAGDKDAVVARVSADGEVLWSTQLGGPGEDKGLAVGLAPDGSVWAAGSAGAALPGQPGLGGMDGWVARLSAAGEVAWLRPVGTAATDAIAGLAVREDGSAVLVGHTGGDLAGARGGDDVLAQAVAPTGEVLWTQQLGGPQDDRGAAVVAGEAGAVTLVATTDGALGVPAGGTDLAVVDLAADGTPGAWRQQGSAQRDGADEFAEANLFVTRGEDGSAWLTALTAGAPAGATNAGAGDVVVAPLDAPDGGGDGGAGS
ncbi:alpha/beta hydrolase-fold protein [Cellulomonas endophytica]|uniref:alpha/beta hydrolase-fold protein n=1 Tax=Cellulomonas endophytica TaxID=2494735 RepID=UPI00101291A3|nr:alpha/beta hydrolase-fold protein [Cellulomonas endophytica]